MFYCNSAGLSDVFCYNGDFVIGGVRFHMFYCNSAGLSDVFCYNGVFVVAGFHCSSSPVSRV